MKDIVVVGGGTAGWLTALILNAYQPEKKITVIESKEIGILGAGEGTVSHIINVLDLLGIPVSDILKHADGTIKNGIKFTNWNGRGKDDFYFNPFGVNIGLNYDSLNTEHYNHTCMTALLSMYNRNDFKNANFPGKVSEEQKVLMIPEANNNAPSDNPIFQYKPLSSFALHFDARKLANFLSSVAVSRGVYKVDEIVTDIVSDDTGNIIELKCQSGNVLPCDFVFDCTGFKRLIIGKHFGSKWKSYQDQLTADSAMPFILDQDSKIEPYTEAIAMKYGWMWKIPVQGRYGCGYVYDSSYISEEEAKREVEEFLGTSIEVPKTFKFNAGCYEETWIKNCVAIGLASGFIEPLEATSIWSSCMSIIDIVAFADRMENSNQGDRDDFNERTVKRNDEIADFLVFHYMGERKDSQFWKDWKNKVTSKNLKTLTSRWKRTVPTYSDEGRGMFTLDSWWAVGIGINWFEQDVINKFVDSNNLHYLNDMYDSVKDYQDEFVGQCVDHTDFLNDLKK